MMIDKVSNRRELEQALTYIAKYARLVKRYQDLITKHKDMVVHYLELKNMKAYTAEDGGIWQKRQSTSITYNVDDLRKLLRRKHIDPSTVIVEQVVEEVDEAVLLKLLQGEVITIEEYESIANRHTSKPYIIKLPDVRKKRQQKAPEPIGLGRQREGQRWHDSSGRGA